MARLSAKRRLGVSPLWQPVLGIGIQFLLNLLIRSHLVALAFVFFLARPGSSLWLGAINVLGFTITAAFAKYLK